MRNVYETQRPGFRIIMNTAARLPRMSYHRYERIMRAIDRMQTHATVITAIQVVESSASNNGVYQSAQFKYGRRRGHWTESLVCALYSEARAHYPDASWT